MLNILQTAIAFADWVKENALSKIATTIMYNDDKESCLNCTYFGRWTWRKLWETSTKVVLVFTEGGI